ncbi:MAG TPA: hypothetical protein VL975_01055 [Candidatus Micrarchaeia archaeon]|nr:hypothetical protein [Terriglobales bacterium]HUB59021.1 hypothetical protein [Candidatus Micrarchaeia archaeon]
MTAKIAAPAIRILNGRINAMDLAKYDSVSALVNLFGIAPAD